MLKLIVFLMLTLHCAVGCDWLDKIKEKQVKMKITGKGLHRQLLLDTRIASLTRFSECTLLYELEIPKGAYVDSDSINSTLFDHYFYAKRRFDVEAPEINSNAQTVVIVANEVLRKTFLIEDKLSLPIHIRYHAAKEGANSEAKIVFRTPTIALDCPEDFKIYKLESCPGKRKYDQFGVKASSKNWILIEPLDKVTVSTTIPVANTSMTNVVLCGTVAAIFVAFAIIVTAKSPKDEDHVKKD